MSLDAMACNRCGEGFEPQEKIVNSNGQLWHTQCFVCAQCFRPFPDDIFYEFEGRKYCEHDFQVLFAPCCNKCNEFIIGRVIKAMNNNWHPQCFTCELCTKELADLGFIRNAGRALCHECNARVKAESQGKYMCHKCHVGRSQQAALLFTRETHQQELSCNLNQVPQITGKFLCPWLASEVTTQPVSTLHWASAALTRLHCSSLRGKGAMTSRQTMPSTARRR
ncbi:LIM domain-containing protein unc-97 [Chionoecetes opilio]|uniref:LIM domain-containing protein unc-97 n=1 Tax=Chionoecetes opilio TaxID=41210 RepID=A0A8J5D0R1_CHIOP|nr:LIM domain-containing protein unc-97 [Chionoecetes opilio]